MNLKSLMLIMCFTELKWIGVINKDSNNPPCQPNLLPLRISLEMNFSIKICLLTVTKLSFPDSWFSQRCLRKMVSVEGRGGVMGHTQFAMTTCQSQIQYFNLFQSNAVPCLGLWHWIIYSLKRFSLRESEWRCLHSWQSSEIIFAAKNWNGCH